MWYPTEAGTEHVALGLAQVFNNEIRLSSLIYAGLRSAKQFNGPCRKNTHGSHICPRRLPNVPTSQMEDIAKYTQTSWVAC